MLDQNGREKDRNKEDVSDVLTKNSHHGFPSFGQTLELGQCHVTAVTVIKTAIWIPPGSEWVTPLTANFCIQKNSQYVTKCFLT